MQLEGTLSIIEVKGAPTKSNKLTVRIDKINETGLRFFSDLSFPLDSQITLNFNIMSGNEIIDLRGHLIGSRLYDNITLFEVEFIKNEQTKLKLTHLHTALARNYVTLYQKADHYYNYFAESSFLFKRSRINLWM